ncbi:MAG: hypothetical protein ACRD1T_28090 [Acidimicrobiia bacterium]
MAGDASAQSIIRQIDHVYVPLDDASTAFTFLTDRLGLPEAWPFSEYGLFGSGGVCMGNVNFEALKGADFPSGRPQHPARITGIAFDPAIEVDELIGALDSRGIGHTPPMPYVPAGVENISWTNVGVDVSEETFVCKYHFDVPARRKQLKDELDAREGGALGVIEVTELVIGTSDRERSIEKWSRLLDPLTRAADDSWSVGDGPGLRLVTSSSDAVEDLVLRVRSIDGARIAAETAGIEVAETDGGLSIAPKELGGLVLQLRE